jgi:CheY-like chemotaxis protein
MTGILKHNDNDILESDEEDTPVSDEKAPLRVLLVDDSILIRKATSRSLLKVGHHVEVAQHGAECLKMLETSSKLDATGTVEEYGFDLILMDLQMPVMDGYEATKRIRAREILMMPDDETSDDFPPHIMIIGVTANTAGEARADCIACGMDGFIEKPLKAKTLRKYITALETSASPL